jgi:hypothetical protein
MWWFDEQIALQPHTGGFDEQIALQPHTGES